MALTPAQMGNAILRNLEAKTGHNVDYWLDVLHESDAADKKSAITYLKDAGLGHFQAQKVYEVSVGADPYADAEQLLEDLFPAGPLRQAYEAFAKTCYALGDDVVVRPCRTYAPFYARTQFAMVTPRKAEELHVGLALPVDFTSDVTKPATKVGGSDRINAAFQLSADGGLTAAQHAVLAKAYQHNA